jgi:signal transduction histidine kinase
MFTSRSPLHLRWPLLVLMASIGLTAVAAFDAQRAVRGQNAVVDRAVREFSSFAAWSYSEHLKQQLSAAAVEVIGAVNHGENMHTNPRVPAAHELVHYLPEDIRCDCHRTRLGPNPSSFFAFKLGTRDVAVALNQYAVPSEGWRVDPMPGREMHAMPLERRSAEDRWIADTLTHRARSVSRDEFGFGMLLARNAGRIVPITYTLMPTAWGDTIVYGVEYTPEAFTGMLAKVLDDKGLLPETFTKGARNRDVVAIRMIDEEGDVIYESVPGVNSPAFTRLALPPEYGSLAMHIMIRPGQASNLIIGGLPRSRLPFLLGLLALAAMMSVVAVVQIRRETAISSMRADFVASISHELRTPLAQIKLYLETLRTGRASTSEQRDWSLGHIERETTRLGNLVENVLRFSRLGRTDGAPAQPIDLADEVERVVDEFRPLAASRKNSIHLVIRSHPLVRMRPEGVRHVIVNLLDNAVKYGPVSQTVSVEVDMRNGNAEVSVSDQGEGVREADREAIWRAFARAKTPTDAAGSGIGLTIVHDVVSTNGGKAWVESASSGGARFVVSVPAAGTSAARGPQNGVTSELEPVSIE